MRRRLGQHFLSDPQSIQRILAVANITAGDRVLEIGPGRGSLTIELAQQAREFVAVEYDAKLAEQLATAFAGQPHIRILHADARDINFADLFPGKPRIPDVKVVANLPYYAAVPILLALFQYTHLFKNCTLMFQKEVAERITATPGTKAYGLLAVTAQYYSTVDYCFSLPPQAFRPPPKVMSAVISVQFLPQPRVHVLDEAHFFQVVSCAFQFRRKTLKNALTRHSSNLFPEHLLDGFLAQLHLPAMIRGEQLSLEEFARLSNLSVQQQLQCSKNREG